VERGEREKEFFRFRFFFVAKFFSFRFLFESKSCSVHFFSFSLSSPRLFRGKDLTTAQTHAHPERESERHAHAREQQESSSSSTSSEKPLLESEFRRKTKTKNAMAHQDQPGTPGSFERDSLFKRLRAKPENKVRVDGRRGEREERERKKRASFVSCPPQSDEQTSLWRSLFFLSTAGTSSRLSGALFARVSRGGEKLQALRVVVKGRRRRRRRGGKTEESEQQRWCAFF